MISSKPCGSASPSSKISWGPTEPIVKSTSFTSARTTCPNGDNSVTRANISLPQDVANDAPMPTNPSLLPETESLQQQQQQVLQEHQLLLHQRHEALAQDKAGAVVAVVVEEVVVVAAVDLERALWSQTVMRKKIGL